VKIAGRGLYRAGRLSCIRLWSETKSVLAEWTTSFIPHRRRLSPRLDRLSPFALLRPSTACSFFWLWPKRRKLGSLISQALHQPQPTPQPARRLKESAGQSWSSQRVLRPIGRLLRVSQQLQKAHGMSSEALRGLYRADRCSYSQRSNRIPMEAFRLGYRCFAASVSCSLRSEESTHVGQGFSWSTVPSSCRSLTVPSALARGSHAGCSLRERSSAK
jgi:hypothetical protein